MENGKYRDIELGKQSNKGRNNSHQLSNFQEDGRFDRSIEQSVEKPLNPEEELTAR